jgi:hypothetical protein
MTTAREMRKDFDAEFPLTEAKVREQRNVRARKTRKVAKDRRIPKHVPEPAPQDPGNATPHQQGQHRQQEEVDRASEDTDSPDTDSPPRRRRNPRLRDRLNTRGIDTTYNPGKQTHEERDEPQQPLNAAEEQDPEARSFLANGLMPWQAGYTFLLFVALFIRKSSPYTSCFIGERSFSPFPPL